MTCGKAAEPSGVIAEMQKYAVEEGFESVTLLAQSALRTVEIPVDCAESLILNIFKGETHDCGNYRGLNLAHPVMKLLQWLLDLCNCKMVIIDQTQFRFVLMYVPLKLTSLFARCRRS